MPVLGSVFSHIALQFRHLVWNNPCFRVESEVDRVLVLHFLKAVSQVVLLSHAIHCWEVIHLLERFELAEFFSRNLNVVPNDINVCVSVSFFLLLLLEL